MVALSQPEIQRRAQVKTQIMLRQGKDINLSDHKLGKSKGSSPYSRAQAAKAKKAPATKKFNQGAYTKAVNKTFGLKK